MVNAAKKYKESKKEDWIVVDEEDFRDLNKDGIVDKEEANILRVVEETTRQYKVLYKDGSIRWVDKPDESNRKVY